MSVPLHPLPEQLELATAQRGMMWLFAAKFGLDSFAGMVQVMDNQLVLFFFWLVYLLLSFAVAYFVFRLVRVIYGTGPAIVCGGLMFSPCLGAMSVLVINGTTMDRLRKGGVKSGFFGVSKKELADLREKAAAFEQWPKSGAECEIGDATLVKNTGGHS